MFDKGLFEQSCEIPERPVYCALNSLVDTTRGFPRWSSLYAYTNEGGDKAYWDGLNACCETTEFFGMSHTWCPEYMYPGKGYWIYMIDGDIGYAPATNCIWDEDLHCVWEY